MEKSARKDEPPSSRPQLFLVGRNSRGNWVVQDPRGVRGGLFVNREHALRYVRSEHGRRRPAFVLVSGVLDLDMTPTAEAASGLDAPARESRERQRRVA